jgi:hypothetical protein
MRGFPVTCEHVPKVIYYPVETLPEGFEYPLEIFSRKFPYIANTGATFLQIPLKNVKA